MKVFMSVLECVTWVKRSVEWEEVKRQTLKWFGHMKRMEESRMTRRVYVSELE